MNQFPAITMMWTVITVMLFILVAWVKNFDQTKYLSAATYGPYILALWVIVIAVYLYFVGILNIMVWVGK